MTGMSAHFAEAARAERARIIREIGGIVAHGYRIVGVDPVASFLTSITRVDGIERGSIRGMYRLRKPREAAA